MPPPALLPDDGGMSFDFIDEPKKAAPPAAPPQAAAGSPGGELLDFVDDGPAPRPPPSEDSAVMPKAEDTAVVPARPESRVTPLKPESHVMPKPAESAVQPKRPGSSRPPPPVMTPGATAPAGGASSSRGPAADEPFELPTPAPDVAARKGAPAGERLTAALGPLRVAVGRSSRWLGKNKKLFFGGLGALVAVVVIGLGVRAGSTDAGLFWMNKISPRLMASGAGKKALDGAAEKLAEGNFLATRGALGTAAQVLQAAPDDDEVRAFFILCASELKLVYGQGGVDWDLAQRTIDKMNAEGPKQIRARAAFALAAGDRTKAKSLLQPLVARGAAETQGIFLYATALARHPKDLKEAAAVIDAALKASKEPSGKLLLLRAQVAKALDQIPEAAGFLDKTLERQPHNGRAMIELADVKRLQEDHPGALALIEKALQPEQKKALDASEEARALLLRGQIYAVQRQHAQAEAAFEGAVALDPSSVEVRGVYGAWRASRHEYEKALHHLEPALAKDPTNPQLIDPAVRSLMGVGKPLDASKRLAEGLKRYPDDPNLLFLQGKVEEGFAKPTDALKSYEAALKKRPDHAEALVASGFLLLNNDDKEGARKKLHAAEASPDGKKSPLVQLVIGDLRLALGDGVGAREHYAKALEMAPDDARAHASMGRALFRLGEVGKARPELETALKTLENDAQLLHDYGSLLRAEGDRAAAKAQLEKATKLSPNDFRIRARLGAVLFELDDLLGAEKELQQASLLGERWAETYFFLGRTFAGQKKLPEAIEQLKRAIEIEPNAAESHYQLGLVFERTAQIGDAIKAFTAASEHDPRMAVAQEHIARNYLLQNVYDDAIAHYAAAVKLDPQRTELLVQQADAEHQAGRMDDAIAHYKKALQENPGLPGAWSRLGVAYKDKACGDCRRQAVQAFLRAEQADPKDANARRELGYLYKEDGRRAESIAKLKKYVELRPDAPDAEQVKDDIYYLSEEKKRSP
jgi:tetratricopeptide (TPR) repeat protein